MVGVISGFRMLLCDYKELLEATSKLCVDACRHECDMVDMVKLKGSTSDSEEVIGTLFNNYPHENPVIRTFLPRHASCIG